MMANSSSSFLFQHGTATKTSTNLTESLIRFSVSYDEWTKSRSTLILVPGHLRGDISCAGHGGSGVYFPPSIMVFHGAVSE